MAASAWMKIRGTRRAPIRNSMVGGCRNSVELKSNEKPVQNRMIKALVMIFGIIALLVTRI